uniref:NADH-ubiquinone oxidoreductase chain 4L n=2 Tax=Octopodidae TaxID=6647 RepID=A0A344AXX0_9MOLL|nr:NADH dehydrogenase subunit 4L [Callistoctopus minor]AWX90466.1 NADH dehydrogenase subunit 4L [Octopus variabilis]ADU57228.1 NADH dehydrogenase subunit 4L [Callistoctopus minor]AWX90479.1 NADH dehydrogenase subunit 4L [Octopus variabilis]AWX90596.1 NADH dehydrogenase subunit 4L [Octopus variabilis]AWX90609.1 NADH dehydrogenase subunit 4L [Octopus variabilis]
MIMNICMLIGVYMYMCGLFVLMFQWKHILNIMLSFEVLTLSVIFMFFFSWVVMSLNLYLVMILMVFSVCEATLGLALLVSFIRLHGNDYVSSMSVYKL